jgi:hypothetical protein
MTAEAPPTPFTPPPSWLDRVIAWLRGWRSVPFQANGNPLTLEPNLRVKLWSANTEFPFRADFVVHHLVDRRVTPPPAAPLATAQGDIIARARPIAGALPVTAVQECRAELERAVSEPRPAGRTGVVTWAYCTDVIADPEHQQAVAARQEARQRARMREWQWQEEEHQIARLAQLVTDPLRATAWWLLGHQNEVRQLGDAADQFCRLRDRLLPPEPASTVPGTVGQVVDEFCARADPVAVEQFLKWSTRLFVTYQQDRLADQLRSVSSPDDPA